MVEKTAKKECDGWGPAVVLVDGDPEKREGFLEEVTLRRSRRQSASFRMRWPHLVNELEMARGKEQSGGWWLCVIVKA